MLGNSSCRRQRPASEGRPSGISSRRSGMGGHFPVTRSRSTPVLEPLGSQLAANLIETPIRHGSESGGISAVESAPPIARGIPGVRIQKRTCRCSKPSSVATLPLRHRAAPSGTSPMVDDRWCDTVVLGLRHPARQRQRADCSRRKSHTSVAASPAGHPIPGSDAPCVRRAGPAPPALPGRLDLQRCVHL
jgi:hypothetical protein